MATTLDLVNAIVSGKSALIQATFDSVVSEKVSSHIEQKRADTIDQMFNSDTNEETLYTVYEGEELEYMATLDEAAGALAGYPKHVIKTLTASFAYGHGKSAGENSSVEKHNIANKSALNDKVKEGLSAGKAVAIHVNGKLHKVISGDSGSYGREEHVIHNDKEQETRKENIYPKAYRSGGKMHYPASHEVTRSNFSRGDALARAVPAGAEDKKFFKDNKVEVHHIGIDRQRIAKSTERAETKKSIEKANNLDDIKTSAANKLADKKVSSNSANKVASDLHAELGKHIAAGNHKDAKQTAAKLIDHIHQHGLENADDKKKEYAGALKDLQKYHSSKYDSYYKEEAKRDMARLRESEDLEEGVVPGSVKKDKDGNVLKFKTVPDAPNPQSHQAKSVLKHVKNGGSYGDRANAAHIKPGISGVADRLKFLDDAKKRGVIKEEDKDTLGLMECLEVLIGE